MISVVVIGSGGQLGTDVVKALESAAGYRVFPLSHKQVDCKDQRSVANTLGELRPQVVVNCAAFVRVEECEDDPEEAVRVNGLGALYVARTCAAIGALCGYISTDYVFDGGKGEPYTERDEPRPINIYGTSKLVGEQFVHQACPEWFIVRMAGVFGKAGAQAKRGNFVEAILSKARTDGIARVVDDVRMSPTYTHDAAQVLERLIRERATGLFHVTNHGGCTWFEFAQTAIDIVGLRCKVEPISSSVYPTKAQRPKDSRLASVRLDPTQRELLRPWQEALRAYLEEKGYLSS